MTAATTKRMLNAGYLRWAPAWAKRASGHVVAKDIDLSSLRQIRACGLDSLRQPSFVEHSLLPALGLTDENPSVFPPALAPALGRGVRSWQYPSQFADYLVHVSRHSVGSYLEIGMEHGGSFVTTVEYLSRFLPLARAVGVDLTIAPGLRRYAARQDNVDLISVDSRSRRFRRVLARHGTFDLVLIDGDHSREGCQSDLRAVLDHANMIALHDIVDSASPGVSVVWSRAKVELAGEFSFYEYTRQYPEVQRRSGRTFLGIGLAIRKTYEARRVDAKAGAG